MSTLQTRLQDLATRIATEIKTVHTQVNGNAGDLSALTTTAKTNLVAALNELKATISSVASSVGATINDGAATSTTQTWSIDKIMAQINAATAALVASAPGVLDTLRELADALGDDPNFAATTATALANRVRFDAAQALTTPQKVQAKANIDALGTAELGNPDTDLVATFVAGLA